MKRTTRIISYFAIFSVVFYAGWSANHWLAENPVSANVVNPVNSQVANKNSLAGLDFSTFLEVKEILEKNYINQEQIDDQKLVEGAIKGMANSLEDPYTEFMTAEETKEFNSDLNDELEGIGAELTVKDGLLVVVSPLKNSPAMKAGLKPDDIIYKIDGEVAAELSLYNAIKKIRGKTGTEVTLTIVRKGNKTPFEVKIIRQKVSVESVITEDLGEGIWHITISQFSDDTGKEYQAAIQQVLKAKAKGLILDLRYNGGGYLKGAVDIVAPFFEANQTVVTVKYRDTTQNEVLRTSGKGAALDLPLVVLINKGSASASEIVAGAIQDEKRGVLIGEKSFGKGSVQEVDPLRDGSSLRFTVANWYTPKERNINKEGLTPDIEVKEEVSEQTNTADQDAAAVETKDAQLQKAVEYLKNLKI